VAKEGPATGVMRYKNQHLSDVQTEAIGLYLAGMKGHEIADKLGINRTTLYAWFRRNDTFNRAIADMLKKAQEDRIQQALEKARADDKVK